MTTFLITGGTGSLGLTLMRRIRKVTDDNDDQIHAVRTLSRHPMGKRNPGALNLIGDVVDGTGVDRAMKDVDVVIHCATGGMRPGSARAEVAGVRTMLAAAKKADARFVYMSIVGIDNHRLPYYKAKLAAEKEVEAWNGDWIIQRSTQFHQLLDKMMRLKMMPISDPFKLQPIDSVEVADRLIGAVADGTTGRLDDMGGPEVLRMDEICTVWRDEADAPSPRLVRLPAIGPLADFAKGMQLCPEFPVGELRWRKWLKRERKIRVGKTPEAMMVSQNAREALAREEARDRVAMERIREKAAERQAADSSSTS